MFEGYKKKQKRPKIYDEFFPILSEDTVSKIWAKILINVLFIEFCILSFINFTANERKTQMPIAQFFYEIFEFFDFRKNKDINGLLYTCIIVFLLCSLYSYSNDHRLRPFIPKHLLRAKHLFPFLQLAEILPQTDAHFLLFYTHVSFVVAHL